MKKKIQINDTLLELMMGIGACGVLIQIIELIVAAVNPVFAGSRGAFALGFWIGIITAVGVSVHMYWSIDRALDMMTDDAEKYMRKAYLIRTLIIIVVALVVHFLKLGYVMACFLGVFCLKFGAFLAPFMHILREKFRKK